MPEKMTCATMSELHVCAMQVMAFRYTFITSVQLLNSFTVPCAFLMCD